MQSLSNSVFTIPHCLVFSKHLRDFKTTSSLAFLKFLNFTDEKYRINDNIVLPSDQPGKRRIGSVGTKEKGTYWCYKGHAQH